MTMRAIGIDRDKQLRWLELERPAAPGPHEVKVATSQVGVCATDREIVRTGAIYSVPDGEEALILGHEASGTVTEIGPGVRAVAVGDCVVPVVTAERNRGITSHGYFRDEFVENEADFVVLPKHLASVAALVEPITVSHHALREANALRAMRTGHDFVADPGVRPQRVLVVGAGPIGALGALTCRTWGYETTVLDLLPPTSRKAAIVREAGCEYVMAAADGEPDTALADFDIVLQTAPAPQLVLGQLRRLRHGGVLSLVGWAGHAHDVSVDVSALVRDLVHAEAAMVGTLGARDVDFRAAVALLGDMHRRWPEVVGQLITRSHAPQDFDAAFKHDPDELVVTLDFGIGASPS